MPITVILMTNTVLLKFSLAVTDDIIITRVAIPHLYDTPP